MSKKESEVKCPYCGVEFDIAPKRKQMCPNCRNTVYPRTNPYNNEMHYLTERELEDFEKIRSRYRAEEKFLKKFQEYGLKQKKFEVKNYYSMKNSSSIKRESLAGRWIPVALYSANILSWLMIGIRADKWNLLWLVVLPLTALILYIIRTKPKNL